MNISLGQIAFEAYSKAKRGKTYDDKPIPHWDDLNEDVREAWGAAAQAVRRATDWRVDWSAVPERGKP